MTNIEIKEIIINEVKPYLDLKSKTPWQIASNKILLKNLNCKYSNFFQGIGELIYLVKNIDIIENLVIFCPMCGNKNPYFNNHYQTHCCQKCSANDPKIREKIEATCYKHFGYKSNLASPDKKLNGRATMKEKTGYESYTQIPGWKEYCQQIAKNRTEEERQIIRLKAEKTYMKHYGVKHNWSSKDSKLNGCAKRKEKYNVNYIMSNPIFVNKALQTKLNTIDENGLNIIQKSTLKSIETNKKNHNGKHNWASGDKKLNGRETCKKLYGNESFTKTKYFKQLFKNKEWVEKINQKIYETKKTNGSLKGSKPEEIIFELLKTKFTDTIHHYKDKERYNFQCDFYIPSKDLFIEINFDPSHGKEPFNPNNKNHLKIVEDWKTKISEKLKQNSKPSRYSNFIDVWTIRDPIKFQTAKQNKLNYLTFYNWKQFNIWFNSL